MISLLSGFIPDLMLLKNYFDKALLLIYCLHSSRYKLKLQALNPCDSIIKSLLVLINILNSLLFFHFLYLI